MSRSFSPFLLEIIKNALDTIADELAIVVMRTAFSSIVRDAIDYSTAVCDAQGRTLAQGLTTPLHLGSFHDAMGNLIALHAPSVRPGDVFIFNDPYLAAGQHLPDIYVVKPIYHSGTLEGWALTLAHHTDVGGIVPGSNSIGSTEIYQEGLRLPVLKLMEAGVENRSVWDIVAANVRLPHKVIGDLRAQVAACERGEREFRALFERYGVAVMRQSFEALHQYAERLARVGIGQIPDGIYRHRSYIDGLGESPDPIELNVSVTVTGEEAIVDWSGTSEQVSAGINAPVPFTKAASYAALRSIFGSEAPNAQGFTRPIRVVAPLGTIVNPRPPAACGSRGITGFRMIDCVLGALAQALPDRLGADGSGGSTIPSIAGMHQGQPFIFVETLMGVSGAARCHDGQEGVAHLGANQSNVPIEIIEAENPLRIERYCFVPDTGGPGEWRGGLAIAREYRLLTDRATLTVRSDKRRFPPLGRSGGQAGAPSNNEVNPGTSRAKQLPVLTTSPHVLREGDLFRHTMAGGGGYGDPLKRNPASVAYDVLLGKVSVRQAREVYGVAIIGQEAAPVVDAPHTEALRRDLSSRRQ